MEIPDSLLSNKEIKDYIFYLGYLVDQSILKRISNIEISASLQFLIHRSGTKFESQENNNIII